MHVVTETRLKVYPRRPGVHEYVDKYGLPHIKDDPGGKGLEISVEVLAHVRCAGLHETANELISGSK